MKWLLLSSGTFLFSVDGFGGVNDPEGWARGWGHHKRKNPHHWQYWIDDTEHGKVARPMPMWAVREMVADWMGASRAYSGEWPESVKTWEWWNRSCNSMLLHEETYLRVRRVFSAAGLE